jgi:sirohydrochlorin cobaltochelatase
MTDTKIGVILFGHGARNPAWALPMHAIATAMRAESNHRTEVAFLEFLQPDLASVCASMYESGLRIVQVKPVFLAGAGHLINDLPGILNEIQSKYVDLKIHQMKPLGDRPEVIDAIAKSFLSEL